MKTLNLEDIGLDSSWGGNVSRGKQRRKKVEGRFLKGPVPVEWLIKAYAVGSGAGHVVGVILWHLSGLKKDKRTVLLTSAECGLWGICRQSKGRALEALEKAGLVAIQRRGNKNPVVTILDGGDGGRA